MSLPSPEHARAAVRRLTPLRAREIVELGRGSDSVAYLVDGEWVARFPAVPAAQATLRRELALLPALRTALPLATPAFEYVGRSGTELLFVAYRSIPGIPLTADTFDALGPDEQEAALASLAEFLRALHAFPVELALRAGVQEERGNGAYNRRQRSLHRGLGSLLSPMEMERLDDIFRRYELDHPPGRLTPTLLHADIKPEHVMYDPVVQRVTGVLDWGDVCLGDPDFDLAVISMFFGEAFLTRLLRHMPDRDPETVFAKVEFFTAVRWLQDLVLDVERDEPADYALQGLRGHLQDRRH
jgi:aminoglycoside 2''-phosphotransferase